MWGKLIEDKGYFRVCTDPRPYCLSVSDDNGCFPSAHMGKERWTPSQREIYDPLLGI